jgi:peptide/nickel transport system permease protein
VGALQSSQLKLRRRKVGTTSAAGAVGRLLAWRAGASVCVWLVATLIVFGLVRAIPGDPATALLPTSATPSDRAAYSAALGLGRPIWTQYWSFLTQLVHANFGESFVYHTTVLSLIGDAAPITLVLVVATLGLSLLISLPAAALAARRPGSAIDGVVSLVTIAGQSFPTFWIGLMLIILFSVKWRVLPATGDTSWRNYILPVVSLSGWTMAVIVGVAREAMREALAHPMVTFARSKGIGELRIFVHYVMVYSRLAIVTITGLEFGFLLSGAVITEVVFGMPGIGLLGYNAILNRDYPVIQGLVLLVAAAVLILNIVVDAAYVALDPRLRYAHDAQARSVLA